MHRERAGRRHSDAFTTISEQSVRQDHPIGARGCPEVIEGLGEHPLVGVQQDQRRHEAFVAATRQGFHRADHLEGVLAREVLDEDLRALEVQWPRAVLPLQRADRDSLPEQSQIRLVHRHGHREPRTG